MGQNAVTLSRKDVRLVQTSFRLAAANPERLAQRFYAHLFRLDPGLRRLFHGGMREQGQKFVDMLALVTARLDRINDLLPAVRELGVRHVGYRVEEAHYATTGAALLAALEELTGAAFTTEVRDAWQRAYDLLATTMIEAARDAAATSSAR